MVVAEAEEADAIMARRKYGPKAEVRTTYRGNVQIHTPTEVFHFKTWFEFADAVGMI